MLVFRFGVARKGNFNESITWNKGVYDYGKGTQVCKQNQEMQSRMFLK